MEKQKSQPGPRPRIKRAVLPPGDFIALGKAGANKPRTPSEVEPKQLSMAPRKPGPGLPMMTGPSGLQKRKDTVSINPVPQKRTFSPFGSRTSVLKGLDIGEPLPAVKIIDAVPHELEELVLLADSRNDNETVNGLICGAIKTMKLNRLKPDSMSYLSLISLSKSNPTIFTSKQIIEHLLQFLRRENTISSVKPKPNTLLSIMTCSILYNTFQLEETWPQSFMKVYIDDALGDRAWVDNESNRDFISNITYVFGTKLPPKINVAPSIFKSSAIESSLNPALLGYTPIKEEEKMDVQQIFEASENLPPQNRYANPKDAGDIQAYVHDIVKDLLNKRQMIDSVSRNLLRFLTSVCGYVEVRLIASQRLETWLQNPKLARPAQELLMSVAMNCNTHSQDDTEVIANIARMRLKAKPVINQHLSAIKELLAQHEDNLSTILKHVIFNELSPQKNPLNMSLLGVIFSTDPDNAAKHLSRVFQDLLASREDYLKSLRGLFREIVRSLKYEVNLVEFCRGLMQERHEPAYSDADTQLKSYILSSVVDLICLGSFLCISPIVKEQAVSLSKNEKRDFSVLQACQTQISTIQRDAVWFFHTKVMKMYACTEKDYISGLKKVLFLENNDNYFNQDGWPSSESDRSLYLQTAREVPLAEDGLLRLHLLALDDNLPINCANSLDIIERLVQRAAVLKSGSQGLFVERMEVLKMLLSLSSYVHPRDIPLPKNYVPPTLAISNLYWKTWLVLVILAATNQATVGLKVWEAYPTGRCFMEMLITGFYEFPPLSVGSMTRDEIIASELQLCRAEKEDILVFEGHLASATSGASINEGNSLLISQLILLDPTGAPRQPPPHVIDKLKTLNENYQLGKLLCQSRNPDFLLSIIECQESSKGMPWLADLVQSSEGSLEELPVQCLCEFLLMNYNQCIQSKHKSIRPKVAAQLQDLLMGDQCNEGSAIELVSYFIDRWSSSEMAVREASIDAFQSILLLQRKRRLSQSSETDMEDGKIKQGKIHIVKDTSYSWLHDKLTQLAFFKGALPNILNSMRKALHFETNIKRLQAYIMFLKKFYKEEDVIFLSLLIDDLSTMFLEREAIMKGLLTSQDGEDHHLETHHALLAIFTDFTKRLFEKHENIITSMKQDVLVEVTWLKSSTVGEKSIDIDIAILQSSLLLFAYNHTHSDEYKYLASIWTATESYSVFDKTTKEKIDIVNNKSLRKLLVVSNLDALVEEGLRNAPSEDLLSLLHTFGLPLNSRKKLLQRLDEVATERPTEILKHITDKQKCLLFAELAMEDDDISGLKFCKLLQPDYLRANGNEEEMDTDEMIDATFVCGDFTDDDDDKKTSEAVSPQIAKLESNLFDDHKEIESALRMYFTSNDKKQVSNYITLKQKVSLQIIKCKDEDNELSNKLLYVLESLLNENEFRDYFMKSSGEACVLINILVKSFPNDSTDRLHDVFLILQHKLNSSHPLSKIFSGIRLTTELRNEHAQTVNDLLNDISKHTKSSKKSKERGRNKKDKQNTNDILDELIAKLKVEDNLEGISKKRLANGLVSISREKPQILEEIITILFEKVKDSRNCRVLLDTLFDMLKKVDPSCLGLLLDWIALIDTEIVHLNPTQQRELLFCKSDSVNVTYFLTLLAQQTRAYTLDDCLTWLLDSPRPVERMDATNRLKLISCMWLNANLWQGRDKNHSLQNDNSGDLHVSLTIPQIVIFIELILTKMMRNEQQQGDQGSENSEEVSEYISLLLLLTQSMSNLLKKAVHIIVQSKRFPDSIVKIFLEHFYLQQPMLVDHKIDEMFELNPPMKNKATIDDTIHRLIMSVSEPNGTQEWKNKFDAVGSISRRMAVQYPRIYRRQLPLLLSTMRGITRMTANRFEKTNQLLFCDHVIDVFDILKAYLFKQDEESVNIMRAYVDAFLQLIMSSCLSMHACVSTLGKFVDFLNHYIASGNADSEKVLYSHEPVFRGLMIDYPNFEGLTSICTFISSSKCKPTLVASHANTWNDVQIDAFKQRLHQDHYIEDLVNVLEDLDESSKRQVDVLSNFVEDLTPLMGSSNDALREKSYVLLFRYAKFNTRVSERLLAKMIECLSDERQQIVKTASRYAPKILTISSGRSDELLECMYKLATSSHRNITNDVIESIGNINIDYI